MFIQFPFVGDALAIEWMMNVRLRIYDGIPSTHKRTHARSFIRNKCISIENAPGDACVCRSQQFISAGMNATRHTSDGSQTAISDVVCCIDME